MSVFIHCSAASLTVTVNGRELVTFTDIQEQFGVQYLPHGRPGFEPATS